MPGHRLALALLLTLGSFQLAAQEVALTSLGSAYDQDSGHLLYTEAHSCDAEGMICTITYRDSFGEMIARKRLDYRNSPVAPEIEMADFRKGERLTVAGGDSDSVVVDAGFDNYVRSVWGALEAGESVRFPFLVAGFDRPIKMRAEQNVQGQCSRDELCLTVAVDSWLVGLLASPIELTYSRSDRKLRQFSGVSNLKGESGEKLIVDIIYRHGNDILLADIGQDQAGEFDY